MGQETLRMELAGHAEEVVGLFFERVFQKDIG
jgi:hypothetical protein